MQPSPYFAPEVIDGLDLDVDPGVVLHGRGAVAVSRGETIELIVSDRALTLDVAASTFAFVGDELWVASAEALHAFDLAGKELRAPLNLAQAGLAPGRLVAGRSPAIAIWHHGGNARLIDADRAPRGKWSLRELDAPVFAGASQLIPTADRRILVVSTSRVVQCTERGRELVTCTAPPSTRIVTAVAMLGGRATAMLVRETDAASVVVHDWHGRRVRGVRVPEDCRAIAFAEEAAMAVVASQRDLLAIDLRLGVTRASAPLAFPVRGFAISPTGASLVIAGASDGILVQIAAETWWRKSAVAPPVPEQEAPHDSHAFEREVAEIEHAQPEQVAPMRADDDEAVDLEHGHHRREQVDLAGHMVGMNAAAPQLEARLRGGGEGRGRSIEEALDAVLSHAGLLYERLVYAGRRHGLLPRPSGGDPLAGLAVDDEELVAILASVARGPAGAPDPYADAIATSRTRLRDALATAESFGLGIALAVRSLSLSDRALDVLVLALAPELDLRFVRIAGFLANDMSRCRPTLGHLMNAARLGASAVRGLDDVDTLELEGLLEHTGDGPAVSRELRVPMHVVELLTTDLEEHHAPSLAWSELVWSSVDRTRLRATVVRELRRSGRLVVLCGAPGSGRMAIARAAATEVGMPLVVCELDAASATDDTRRRGRLLSALVHARLTGAALAIRWRRVPRDPLWSLVHARAKVLGVPCLVITSAGDLDGVDGDVPFVRFDAPTCDAGARHALWSRALTLHGFTAHAAVVDDLSTRYQLTPGRLLESVEELRSRDATRVTVDIECIRDTLGSITVGRLGNLAVRHRSTVRLEDLALPEAVSSRITELVRRIQLRRRVLSDWSFADRTHDGYGVSALFVGPPGTGKTAAAAAIANALGIDLHVVDLSQIMSKWVGETEQNLARVFDEAEASNVALLFDEADALFGKRSVEQKSGSDRFANITINYLLQRMERYAGLAILTTNLMSAMDAAFQRRITSTVHFPPSDEDMRFVLWRKLLPTGASFAEDVDLRRVASAFELEAAHIRRALVRAAFRAASRGQHAPILNGSDLTWAAAAEYEDLGRIAHRFAPHHNHGGDA